MSQQPSEKFTALIKQLQDGEITPEQFKLQSAELIDAVGPDEAEAKVDTVRLERVDAAASMIRSL